MELGTAPNKESIRQKIERGNSGSGTSGVRLIY
jgi:hypothetical protein